MELSTLFIQQGTVFILMLVGLILKKKGIIDVAGRTTLTDLCINVIIPCNIFKSFLMNSTMEMLRACLLTIVVGFAIEGFCLVLNKFLFNKFPDKKKKILQYGTLVTNAGFLGTAIVEGIYGAEGVMYGAIFLIPMRIIMWSAGTAYFVSDGGVDKKKIIKNIVTHPCLVAVYLGTVFLLTQWKVPGILLKPIQYIGNCNTAITMIIVGTILADEKLITVFTDGFSYVFSAFRLLVLPAVCYGLCLLLGMSGTALGVSVLMIGMPMASTTAIFAARYGSDASFATKCVVLSTLLSMLTIPLWGAIL